MAESDWVRFLKQSNGTRSSVIFTHRHISTEISGVTRGYVLLTTCFVDAPQVRARSRAARGLQPLRE